MKVLFCGTGWLPIVDAIRERAPAGTRLVMRNPAAPVVDQLRDVEVILPSNFRLDREAIAAPVDLRLIQQPAAGIDGVDLEAARARGVPVCNAPGKNHDSVADVALLLMLALARRLPVARRAFAAGELGVPLGIELRGKTLGVFGMGRAGAALARVAEAIGMRVLGVRSTSSAAERETLLRESDFISLHCPLTPRTRGALDDAAFAVMKPGVFLVNCARGPIIDRGALERALEAGKLGGVGLDAFWHEPWEPSDSLYSRDDVVTLPHIGGSTVESFARIADVVADNLARIARGDEPRFRVV